MKKYLPAILSIFFGAFILCIPSIYNGYPLVYSDTCTYIDTGFKSVTPLDRPLTYGLFVRHSSLAFSLWFTIVAQSLLVASMVYMFMETFFQARKLAMIYVFSIMCLTFFTGIGWYSCQVMPDTFAPVLALSVVFLALNKKMHLAKLIAVSIIMVFSAATHFSHLVLSAAFSALFLGTGLLFYIRKKNVVIPFKRIFLITGLCITAWFYVLILHYTHEGGFRLSRGKHVFLMSHFIESGTMQEFLKENCGKPELKDCKMCLYKDSLEKNSGAFLWVWTSSLYKMGGWEKTEDEFNYLINTMNSDPKYLVKNVAGSVRFGFSQLINNNVGEGMIPYPINTPPYLAIDKYFNDEMNPYLTARQMQGAPLFAVMETLNDRQNLLLFACVLICLLYYVFYRQRSSDIYYYGILIILFILLNAFLTAGMNVPVGRLQARIVWLLPMFVIVLVAINYKKIIQRITSLIKDEDNLHRP